MPTGCKFHSASCQLDANFIQSATSRMQISFSRPPAKCKFHSVSHQPDANCIRLAAMQYKIPKFINSLHAAGTNQMKFASGWQPGGCKFAEISS
jgi:hypothetical protein